MKLTVVRIDIVYIIRCSQPYAMFFGKIAQRTVDCLFLWQSMILYFEKKMFPSEYLHIFANEFISALHIPP